jgi:hypothetical protein
MSLAFVRACRVEHHAAPALQQAAQEAESTDSDDSCSSSQPEQLHADISSASPPLRDAASHPAEEPLHGHSRYSKVRDISRRAVPAHRATQNLQHITWLVPVSRPGAVASPAPLL